MNNSLSVSYHYPELIKKLQEHCERKRSGTMFITTDENHSVRFVLKHGIIVFVSYRFKNGSQALSLIQKVKKGISSFKQNIFSGQDDPNLENTPTLLEILANSSLSASFQADKKQPLSQEELLALDEKIQIILAELSSFIGPVAQVVCDEYIEDYGKPSNDTELAKMLAVISGEIGDSKKEEQFRKQLTRLEALSH